MTKEERTSGFPEVRNSAPLKFQRNKETMDGVRREAEGLSKEHESRDNGQMGAIQAKDWDQNRSAQLRSRQQPQVQLLRWDRFLPFRSLKVLLVENDDSTRHGVGALLRNCGYEVKDVSDGKQAWKVLEDITIDVDLVLTEIVMPSLSGIGLLGKIMSNKTFKDIPVIMMSSNDSRSLVFQCLSKGAVDFLVKPIRKNELKNLWQHVWRKHHTSSGIWIEKPMKSSTVEESDNTGSNNEGDTKSIGLYFRDESDSGTQSSWTRTVDLNSPQAMSPRDQFADPPDSTCAQAINPRKEAICINWLPESATRTPVGRDEDLDKKMMGKDLKIGMCGIPSLQLEEPYEKGLSNKVYKSSELNSKKSDKQVKIAELDLNIDEPNAEKTQAVDLMGVSTNCIDPRIESVVLDISNGLTNGIFMKDKAIHDSKEIPFFDVISKRPRDVKDTRTSIHDRNVMRRADLSAFIRYNSASTANEAPTGNVGSCSPLDNSSDAKKAESAPNNQSDSSGTPPSLLSNGSSTSKNNDMESTTNDAFANQVAYADKPTAKSNVKLQTSSSFQQVQNGPTIHGASQNCSSKALRAPTGGNAGNRNRRSNGLKRSTTASICRGKKMGSDNRVTGNGGTIEGTGYGNQRGENENRFAQREAALKRFRQKRLERCFGKKVRYESRKILAEQRPRIRGQFIRKGMQEN